MAPTRPRPDTRWPDVARAARLAHRPRSPAYDPTVLRATREMTMDRRQQQHPAQLLTVRLWQEDLGEGQREWRGQRPRGEEIV